MPEPSPYLPVAAALRARIQAGEDGYRPGDRLPGEVALSEEFGVARASARAAIARLKDEGLVSTHVGTRPRVRAVPPVRRMTVQRFEKARREQGYGAADVELTRSGFVSRTAWIGPDARPYVGEAPGDDGHGGQRTTAELLGVPVGTKVMVRARHMFAAPRLTDGRADYDNEEVMQVATSYIPLDIAEANPGSDPGPDGPGEPGIMVPDTGRGGLYSRIEDVLGYWVGEVSFVEKWKNRIGGDAECEMLHLDPLSLVLTCDRQAFDRDGRVIEVCRHVMAPTFFEVEFTWTAS